MLPCCHARIAGGTHRGHHGLCEASNTKLEARAEHLVDEDNLVITEV